MDITINGKPADITLEDEKTIGDVLSGLEQWLAGSGSRLSGLSIDGEKISAETIPASFDVEISSLKEIDIRVSTWVELAAEALETARQTCALYSAASFENRGGIAEQWLEGPAAAFLSQEIPEMAGFVGRTLKGEGLSPEDLTLLAEERLRELGNPRAEIDGAEALVSGIAVRMEDLPLDIQTGKDGRAAETMQLFSRMGEKLFRLLLILKTGGLSLDTFTIDGESAEDFMNDFSAALRELAGAYESSDSVLIGDLSEYELAPRLLKFYSALKENAALSIS